MRKFYFANIMREEKRGELSLTGSRMVGIWLWQAPAVAYKKLASTGGTPVDMRRIR